jgi:hypothetical protein
LWGKRPWIGGLGGKGGWRSLKEAKRAETWSTDDIDAQRLGEGTEAPDTAGRLHFDSMEWLTFKSRKKKQLP